MALVDRIVGLVLCWCVIAIAFHAMGGLDIPSDPAGPFMQRYVQAWLGWLGACVLLGVVGSAPARAADPDGHAGPWPSWAPAVGWILAGGLVLRLVAWNVPVLLETDVHRYMWDGYVVADGGNPYCFAPEEVMRAQKEDVQGLYREDVYWKLRRLANIGRLPVIAGHLSQVNHPEVPTCYPPLAELAFGLAARLAPGDVRAWKALVTGVDMGICVLVVGLLLALGRDPRWVVFYAWCPLPIKEYANTGHYDPVATIFVVAAVWALVRRRGALGGALLGLGIAGKVYPLVLVPVLWRRLGPRGIGLALLVPWLLLIPFADAGPEVFDGLFAFAKDWEFNSSVFALAAAGMAMLGLPEFRVTTYWKVTRGSEALPLGDYLQEVKVDGFMLTKALMAVLVVVALGALARWDDDQDHTVPGRALAALTVLLVLAPVCDPWYLPWLLPYAAAFPSPAWLYLAGSMVCYYAYFLAWGYPVWQRPVEYLPFFGLLAWSLRRGLAAHLASFEPGSPAPIPETGCDSTPGSARPSD